MSEPQHEAGVPGVLQAGGAVSSAAAAAHATTAAAATHHPIHNHDHDNNEAGH